MLDGFPVFGFQVAYYVPNASADLLFEFHLVARRRFSSEQFMSFRLRRPFAVVVDDGIPQYPVEPCHNTLLVPELDSMFESLYICQLENVFRSGRLTDPSRDEAKELRVMCSNPTQNCTLSRIVLANFTGCRIHFTAPL